MYIYICVVTTKVCSTKEKKQHKKCIYIYIYTTETNKQKRIKKNK